MGTPQIDEGRCKPVSRRLTRLLFSKRGAAFFLALLLALNLAVLFVLAKYNRPTGDDYAFCYLTMPAWRGTHSIFALFASAIKMSAWVYQIWQGSYSAVFLMALQPGIFGETAYAIVPIFLLTFFILSVGVFFFTCLKRFVGMNTRSILIAALLYALVTINFLPSGAQAFYWFNGGVYYTFFFSLSLLAVSLIVGSFRPEARLLPRCVVGALLSLFIGGGNLVTGLSLTLILGLAAAICLFTKRRAPVLFTCFLFLLAGFLFNVFAPGNALRMESEGTGRGVFETIGYCILYTLELYGEWFSVPVLLSGLLLIPVFLPCIRRLAKRFSFRYPALVSLFLILLNAAGYAPLLYSGSNLYIPRLHNIQFYESVLLYYVGLFYLTGWAVRVHNSRRAPGKLLQSACVALMIATCFVFLLPAPPFQVGTQKEITGFSAYHSLINRDAYRYARIRNARQALLEAPDTSYVMLHPIYDSPELFHFRDLDTDPENFSNRMIANYFGKDVVVLTPQIDAN